MEQDKIRELARTIIARNDRSEALLNKAEVRELNGNDFLELCLELYVADVLDMNLSEPPST